ncbi:MAG: Uma2 family endonuclease [Anaerolineae bacterium]|nr:Uma2 family endonuclease [Anaerolineae bacterium]
MVGREALTLTGMAMEEFIDLFNHEGPFELIDDQRRPKVPTTAEHAEIIKLLNDFLATFERNGTIVRYTESTFVLSDRPDWVKGSRLPDVMVYAAARMVTYKAAHPDWKQKPFILVPDVCIEVVSPTDQYTDVDEKVARYLSDGVRCVWVLNARAQSVIVHTLGTIQRLTAEDTLDGGDLIPGFSMNVSALFAV